MKNFRVLKIPMDLGLIEKLESDAVNYSSFTQLLNTIVRQHYLNKEIQEEMATLR